MGSPPSKDRIKTTHLESPHCRMGLKSPACNPYNFNPILQSHLTTDPDEVTCGSCQRTNTYKAAVEAKTKEGTHAQLSE